MDDFFPGDDFFDDVQPELEAYEAKMPPLDQWPAHLRNLLAEINIRNQQLNAEIEARNRDTREYNASAPPDERRPLEPKPELRLKVNQSRQGFWRVTFGEEQGPDFKKHFTFAVHNRGTEEKPNLHMGSEGTAKSVTTRAATQQTQVQAIADRIFTGYQWIKDNPKTRYNDEQLMSVVETKTGFAGGVGSNILERLPNSRLANMGSQRHWLTETFGPQSLVDERGNEVKIDFSSRAIKLVEAQAAKIKGKYAEADPRRRPALEKLGRQYSGLQYAREPGKYHGPNLVETFAAGQGQMAHNDPKTGRFAGFLNFKGKVAGGNVLPSAAGQTKSVQQIGTQPRNVMVNADTGEELPIVRSPFVQYGPGRERQAQDYGHATTTVFTSENTPEGQAGMTGQRVLVKQSRLTVEQLRRGQALFQAAQHIQGKRKAYTLGSGRSYSAGDWSETQVTPLGIERFEDINRSMYRVDSTVSAIGHSRQVSEGIKAIMGSYNSEGMYGYVPEPGEVAMVMQSNDIKSMPAFVQSALGGLAFRLGSKALPEIRKKADALGNATENEQDKYALQAQIMDSGLRALGLTPTAFGEFDWEEEQLPQIKKAFQGVINSPEYWRKGTSGQDLLVLPTLSNLSRSGMYSHNSHAVRSEVAMGINAADPEFGDRIRDESSRMRRVYGGIINAAMVMAAEPNANEATSQGDILPSRGYFLSSEGKPERSFMSEIALNLNRKPEIIDEVAREARSLASADTLAAPDANDFIQAVVKVYDGLNLKDDLIQFGMTVPVTGQGSKPLRLLSGGQLKYLSGMRGIWQNESKGDQTEEGDLMDQATQEAITRIVSGNAKVWQALSERKELTPAEYDEYQTLITETAEAQGIWSNWQALHPSKTMVIGGPVAAHKDVRINEYGLDDAQIRDVFGVQSDDEIEQIANLLETNDISGFAWREPNWADQGILQPRMRAVRKMGLDTTDFGGRGVVNPVSPYVALDFDADALKVVVKNFKKKKDLWQYVPSATGSQTDVQTNMLRDRLRVTGNIDKGLENEREWANEHSSQDRILKFFNEKVEGWGGAFGYTTAKELRDFFTERLDYKTQVGVAINQVGRVAGNLTDNNPLMQLLTSNINQLKVDQISGSTYFNNFFNGLTGVQAASAATKDSGFGNMDRAMQGLLENALYAPEFGDKEALMAMLYPEGDTREAAIKKVREVLANIQNLKGDERTEAFRKQIGTVASLGEAAAPWTNAHKLGPLVQTLKSSMIARFNDSTRGASKNEQQQIEVARLLKQTPELYGGKRNKERGLYGMLELMQTTPENAAMREHFGDAMLQVGNSDYQRTQDAFGNRTSTVGPQWITTESVRDILSALPSYESPYLSKSKEHLAWINDTEAGWLEAAKQSEDVTEGFMGVAKPETARDAILAANPIILNALQGVQAHKNMQSGKTGITQFGKYSQKDRTVHLNEGKLAGTPGAPIWASHEIGHTLAHALTNMDFGEFFGLEETDPVAERELMQQFNLVKRGLIKDVTAGKYDGYSAKAKEAGYSQDEIVSELFADTYATLMTGSNGRSVGVHPESVSEMAKLDSMSRQLYARPDNIDQLVEGISFANPHLEKLWADMGTDEAGMTEQVRNFLKSKQGEGDPNRPTRKMLEELFKRGHGLGSKVLQDYGAWIGKFGINLNVFDTDHGPDVRHDYRGAYAKPTAGSNMSVEDLFNTDEVAPENNSEYTEGLGMMSEESDNASRSANASAQAVDNGQLQSAIDHSAMAANSANRAKFVKKNLLDGLWNAMHLKFKSKQGYGNWTAALRSIRDQGKYSPASVLATGMRPNDPRVEGLTDILRLSKGEAPGNSEGSWLNSINHSIAVLNRNGGENDDLVQWLDTLPQQMEASRQDKLASKGSGGSTGGTGGGGRRNGKNSGDFGPRGNPLMPTEAVTLYRELSRYAGHYAIDKQGQVGTTLHGLSGLTDLSNPEQLSRFAALRSQATELMSNKALGSPMTPAELRTSEKAAGEQSLRDTLNNFGVSGWSMGSKAQRQAYRQALSAAKQLEGAKGGGAMSAETTRLAMAEMEDARTKYNAATTVTGQTGQTDAMQADPRWAETESWTPTTNTEIKAKAQAQKALLKSYKSEGPDQALANEAYQKAQGEWMASGLPTVESAKEETKLAKATADAVRPMQEFTESLEKSTEIYRDLNETMSIVAEYRGEYGQGAIAWGTAQDSAADRQRTITSDWGRFQEAYGADWRNIADPNRKLAASGEYERIQANQKIADAQMEQVRTSLPKPQAGSKMSGWMQKFMETGVAQPLMQLFYATGSSSVFFNPYLGEVGPAAKNEQNMRQFMNGMGVTSPKLNGFESAQNIIDANSKQAMNTSARIWAPVLSGASGLANQTGFTGLAAQAMPAIGSGVMASWLGGGAVGSFMNAGQKAQYMPGVNALTFTAGTLAGVGASLYGSNRSLWDNPINAGRDYYQLATSGKVGQVAATIKQAGDYIGGWIASDSSEKTHAQVTKDASLYAQAAGVAMRGNQSSELYKGGLDFYQQQAAIEAGYKGTKEVVAPRAVSPDDPASMDTLARQQYGSSFANLNAYDRNTLLESVNNGIKYGMPVTVDTVVEPARAGFSGRVSDQEYMTLMKVQKQLNLSDTEAAYQQYGDAVKAGLDPTQMAQTMAQALGGDFKQYDVSQIKTNSDWFNVQRGLGSNFAQQLSLTGNTPSVQGLAGYGALSQAARAGGDWTASVATQATLQQQRYGAPSTYNQRSADYYLQKAQAAFAEGQTQTGQNMLERAQGFTADSEIETSRFENVRSALAPAYGGAFAGRLAGRAQGDQGFANAIVQLGKIAEQQLANGFEVTITKASIDAIGNTQAGTQLALMEQAKLGVMQGAAGSYVGMGYSAGRGQYEANRAARAYQAGPEAFLKYEAGAQAFNQARGALQGQALRGLSRSYTMAELEKMTPAERNRVVREAQAKSSGVERMDSFLGGQGLTMESAGLSARSFEGVQGARLAQAFSGFGSDAQATSFGATVLANGGGPLAESARNLISVDQYTGRQAYQASFGLRQTNGQWVAGSDPGSVMRGVFGKDFSASKLGKGWSVVNNAPGSKSASTKFADGEYMYTQPTTGRQYSGTQAWQIESGDVSYASQMASIGASIANTQRQWMFTSGKGIGKAKNIFAGQALPWSAGGATGQAFEEGQGQWYWGDRQEKMQREQSRWQLGMSQQQLGLSQSQFASGQALSLQQFLEKWQFGRKQTDTQYGWQQQDMALNRGAQLMQRGWQQQDHVFQQSELNRSFGYQMEDYDINIRYATGRDRKAMERQKKRDVTSHNISEGRMDVEEGRQKKTWKLEDERYNIDVSRAAQQYKWAVESSDMDKKQFIERADLDRLNFEQRNALEVESMNKQQQWLVERETIEDAIMQIQKSAAQADMEASIAAAGAQAGYATKQKEIQDNETTFQDDRATAHDKAMLTLWGSLDAFTTELGKRITELTAALRELRGVEAPDLLGAGARKMVEEAGLPGDFTGASLGQDGEPIVTPPNDVGNNAYGVSFLATRPTNLRVGEGAWSEMVTVRPQAAPGLPSFHPQGSTGGTGGTPAVHIYLDGKEISGQMVTRLTQQVSQGRRL